MILILEKVFNEFPIVQVKLRWLKITVNNMPNPTLAILTVTLCICRHSTDVKREGN